MPKTEQLDKIAGYISLGNQCLKTGQDVLSLTNYALDVADQATTTWQRLSVEATKWREASAATNTVMDTFQERRQYKQEFLHTALIKTADYIRENSGLLTNRQDLLQAVPTLLNTMFTSMPSPLAGSIISAGLGLVDGYMTRRTLRAGFDQIDSSINSGFYLLNINLHHGLREVAQAIGTGFAELSASFNWGISELMWRVDQQTDIAKSIERALTNPLDVQASELRARAIRSYNFGWFEESLSDFEDAMQKARVDHVIAQYIGNIYLFYYGNYDKAIEYYRKAAKYSEPTSRQHAIVALMHEGLAHYLSSGADREHHLRAAVECLRRAIRLGQSLEGTPDLLELQYQYAQYNALLAMREETLHTVEQILKERPSYLVKIIAEDDFLVLKDDLVQLFERLHTKTTLHVAKHMDRHAKLLRTLEMDQTGYFSSDDRVQEYLLEIARIGLLYSQGDFVSLRRAEERLEMVEMPIQEPRKLSSTYSYSTVFHSDTVSETENWALGGELL